MNSEWLRATPLYRYLDSRLCWCQDPSTSQWFRGVGPDAKTLGTSFKRDPIFPKAWICQVANNPEVDVIGEVIGLLLPAPLPDEIDLLHGALDFACAVEEDDLGKIALAGFGVVVGVIGLVGWNRNRRAA